MPIEQQPHFTIVGAGLAGALMACYLGKAGYRVQLYEKRSDPRGREQEEGRSINLAISVRGIHALREVGLADDVLRAATPMRGRMMHARSGALSFQPYGKDDTECINSVSRAGLNRILVEAAARYASVGLVFGHRCTGIDLRTGALQLHEESSQQAVHVPAECVIGADGTYSAIRAQMQRQERFDYHQEYLSHGYKEVHIPAGHGGGFRMEAHALHIWPRQSFMMIALPNHDGSFTGTLFLPYEGPNSFAELQTEDDIRRFFDGQFPDAVPLMPDLVEDFRKNPVGSLVTVRCSPWHVEERIVLIGDACHAVVPFLGQGMNAAFEDCTVLGECLARFAPDWEVAFRSFESQRKANVDTLAELAVDNFLEMRDRVSSRAFLLKKRFDNLLHKLFPRWYLPLYTLVTFTRTPYAQARQRVQEQQRVVRAIVATLLVFVILAGLGLFWRETH
jgi:kynurenine 3-monooxygenase